MYTPREVRPILAKSNAAPGHVTPTMQWGRDDADKRSGESGPTEQRDTQDHINVLLFVPDVGTQTGLNVTSGHFGVCSGSEVTGETGIS